MLVNPEWDTTTTTCPPKETTTTQQPTTTTVKATTTTKAPVPTKISSVVITRPPQVLSSATQLPHTGVNSAPLVVVALILIGGGVALRRRALKIIRK